jgi:hypothetical protein
MLRMDDHKLTIRKNSKYNFLGFESRIFEKTVKNWIYLTLFNLNVN